jgi:hypothetical protein
MPNPPTRKTKTEAYTYSWFLPAPGANPPTGPAPAPEDPPAESPGQVEELAVQAQVRGRGLAFPRLAFPRLSALSGVLKSDSRKIRLIGLFGWSDVAAVGMALTMARSGSSLQVGAIAGLWLAISAVIWILPTKLKR